MQFVSSTDHPPRPLRSFLPFFISVLVSGLVLSLASTTTTAEESLARGIANPIVSVTNGKWSEPTTWNQRRVPGAGDVVLVKAAHEVNYDCQSEDVLRSLHISGCLRFSTDRSTEMNVGLIRIEGGDEITEDGFDCAMHQNKREHDPRASLLIGSPNQPVAPNHRCLIRLHPIAGTDIKSWPAIVCCGGRLEMCGSPMNRTWVKLTRTADAGATKLFLADHVTGWRAGDQLVITGTARQEPSAGVQTPHVTEQTTTETRRLVSLSDSNGVSMTAGARATLQLDEPLHFTHRGGEYSAEVANLSRNVVIESAFPEQARGHTMFHHGSMGSIHYVEFRHLGKEGVLGRYPIHFHLAEDSMRGSSLIGNSIWDSANRWVTIHGSQYLLVRDNVGYQSRGHGFFLEDGTETRNVIDRNLAIQALVGKPLPDQVLPYDENDGAGFWWANNVNVFTRNVAVDCDQHGFRFEVEESDKFKPQLLMSLCGEPATVCDLRTLPFIRFSDNEAHCQRRFGLNLGGIRGLTYQDFQDSKDRDTYASSIGGTTGGVGPAPATPLEIRNFKVWDTHWAFHTYCPAVKIDGLDVYDCNYGIWRSVIDEHQYDNLSFKEIHSHSIFFPMGGHRAGITMSGDQPKFPNYKAGDKHPPSTIVLSTTCNDEDKSIDVQGISFDNQSIAEVHVGDTILKPAAPTAVFEWQIKMPRAAKTIRVSAFAIDTSGNQEFTPHRLPASLSSQD